MLSALTLTLLTQCSARVPELLFERLVENPVVLAELSEDRDPVARLQQSAKAQAVKMCVTPAPVFVHWVAWEQTAEPDGDVFPEYPRQKELDAWLGEGARAVIVTLGGGKVPPEELGGEALCERAMTAVAPGLRSLAEPVADRAHKVWKEKWPDAAVAKFYADACKAEKVHASHRAALVCYARVKGGTFRMLERMDACDLDVEPSLDSWMEEVGTKLEALLAKGR